MCWLACSNSTQAGPGLDPAAQVRLQGRLVGNEHTARLAALEGTEDAGGLQLVHDAARTVASELQLALDNGVAFTELSAGSGSCDRCV